MNEPDQCDDAYVYLGFQHAPEREDWAHMIRDQDRSALLGCFDRVPVRPGEWSGGELTILIATRGAGTLSGGSQDHEVRCGETWLLPGAVPRWHWQATSDDWEILLAQPATIS